MNNVARAHAVQTAVKRKFYGNRTLHSKAVTHFPVSISDEYERTVQAYMGMLNQVLRSHLPTIRRAIAAEQSEMRQDSVSDVLALIGRVFIDINTGFSRRARHFGLERRIERLAAMSRRHSVREWKRVVHRTLGISIMEGYYAGEFYRHALERWTANNASLIKSLPDQTLTRMQNIIQNGYFEGKSNAEMGRLIQDAYGVDRNRALFIARDQTAKLNSDLTKQQQEDAGVEEYVWDSSGDSRVRECHAYLNGKTFRWDDPPEMWYMTKRRGRVYTGRRCHPGEDYQCRCVALPKFRLETLNLPWEGDT